MAILSVHLWNYKIHKDLKLDPNGKSFLIVGDSGFGKSTLIEFIEAAFGQTTFPSDPLSEGEDEGAAKLVYEHTNGFKYTIQRRFNKAGLKRFEVISSDGGKMSQEKFLEEVMKSAFDNKFDHDKYFNKANSTVARIEYLVKAFGGDKVFDNNIKIKEKIEERGVIGGQKKMQQNLYMEDFPIDPDLLISTYKNYKDEKPFSLAKEAKDAYLRTHLVDVESLKQEVQLYEEIVVNRDGLQQSLTEVDDRQKEIKKLLAELKKEAKELVVYRETVQLALDELDHESITELDNVRQELSIGLEKNEDLYVMAETVFETAITDITKFNTDRGTFLRAVKSFQEHERLETEWNQINDEIAALKDENKKIFIENIPIQELTIDFDEKGNPIPLYNGREFKYPNLSVGESLEITSRIQDALNPGGSNFIVIPEAQSMGSKIDSVMEYCKDKNIQAIVEMTKRDEKFKIVVTDDARKV